MPRRNAELIGPTPRTPRARSVGPGDRYLLARLLASDPLGTLWVAQDTDGDSPVTIRMLDPVLSTDLAVILRFVRLVGRAQGIRHDNLARILAHHAGRSAIDELVVMEPLHGTTLAHVLADGARIPRGETLAILAAIAQGLACAHREGVAHGNLTPDHVLVTSDGGVKLLDLGIAALEKEREDAEPTPEGQDPAEDVRALAALAARLLGGDLVLLTESLPTRALWTGLPEHVAGLLQSALAASPASRPPARELADALASAPGLRPPNGLAARTAPRTAPPAPPAIPEAQEDPGPAAPVGPSRIPASDAWELPSAVPRTAKLDPARQVRRAAAGGPARLVLAVGVLLLLAGAAVWVRFGGDDPQPTKRNPLVQIQGTTVPDVLGLPYERAEERLRRADLVVGQVLETSGEKGIVMATDPTPGEAVRAGSGVTVLRGSSG
jgi:eukaryotic-like serine/threonine-protein kinase